MPVPAKVKVTESIHRSFCIPTSDPKKRFMVKRSKVRTYNGVLEKNCTKCGTWLAAEGSKFPPLKEGRFGLHPWCRECVRDYKRQHQARVSKPIRKIQALPDSGPRIQRPMRRELRYYLDSVCTTLDDSGSRFRAYLIRNQITGECYVGITERALRARWGQHVTDAVNGKGSFLHQKMREFGILNFSFEHIASARTRSDLNQLEKILVAQHGCVEHGYNQTRGGAAGESVGNPVTVIGREFISLNAAARQLGVPEASVHQRMKRYGWTLEEALGVMGRSRKRHRIGSGFTVGGKIFENFCEACEHHQLNETVVRSRLKHGWSLEEAFNLSPRTESRIHRGKLLDVAGVTYESIASAARAHGIEASILSGRIRAGWTPEQAANLVPTAPRQKPGIRITIAGQQYLSVADACRSLGRDPAVVSGRLRTGWSIEQAFDLSPPPAPSGEKNGQAIAVEGKTYSSQAKAARAHGLDPRVVHKRLKKFGWTVPQAFGIDPPPK